MRAQREFRDALGRRLIVGFPPDRIVSLVPGITETLFAVGAGEAIAGLTDFCSRPQGTRVLPLLGGVRNPSVAAVADLEPDLVFASVEENRKEDVAAIEARGVPVFVTRARSVAEAVLSIRAIAAAAGRARAGKALARKIEARLGEVPAPRRRVPVLFPVWEKPLIAPGRGTFVADLLRRAGAVSVAEALGAGWPRCPRGFAESSGARAVLLPSEPFPYGEKDRRRWLERSSVPACAAGNVFLVDGERTNRPGPRMADGVEEIRDLLDALVRS